MKALEWLRYLENQLRQEGKKLFSVTELGNVAKVPLHDLNVALNRLVQQDVLARYAHGVYGLPGAAAAEDLLPWLDNGAYVTGLYALHRHNLVTQVPMEIACFTNRRHNRSRVRNTSLGRFEFICVKAPVYRPPDQGVLAPPEQALHDYIRLSHRLGVSPLSLVTFRRLGGLDISRIKALAAGYPKSVGKKMEGMLVQSGLK